MRSRQPASSLLWSQFNLTQHVLSARADIINFARQKSAEFRAAGGRFRAPKMMSGFGSFNAATKIIDLSRSEMADAKLATLVEELIHFEQAQAAGVFGKERGWFSRYILQEWQVLKPVLEADVDQKMIAMGFGL